MPDGSESKLAIFASIAANAVIAVTKLVVAAMLFFSIGGGLSVYEGVLHLLHPEPLRDPTIAVVAIILAARSRGLLVGERAHDAVRARCPAVHHIFGEPI